MLLGTGAGVETANEAFAATPSTVALIAADPACIAITSPVALTLATLAFVDVHDTTRFESVLPDASFTTALAWTVWPTVSELGLSTTTTDAAGATVDAGVVSVTVEWLASLTVTLRKSRLFSLSAVIFVVPAAIAVSRPVELTLAIAGLELLHVTERFSTFPDASLSVAVSWVCDPRSAVREEGLIVTLETAGGFDCALASDACPSVEVGTPLSLAQPTK